MATESYFHHSCKRGNHELCVVDEEVRPYGCACTCHAHDDYTILTEQGIWHIAIGRYVGTLVEAIDKWVDIAMRENNVNGVIDSFESLTEAGDEIRRAIKANGERLTGLEEALVNLNNAQKAVEAERRAVDESRGA